MNTSMSNTHVQSMSSEDKAKLSNTERMLLLLPMAGGLVFGLGPFLFGSAVGAAVGFPGNDAYLYRLAGAAAFGYAMALIMGIRQGEWAPLRQVVIGTLTFNLASIFACVATLISGDTNIFVYLILAASIIFIAITLLLLNRHGGRTGKRKSEFLRLVCALRDHRHRVIRCVWSAAALDPGLWGSIAWVSRH